MPNSPPAIAYNHWYCDEALVYNLIKALQGVDENKNSQQRLLTAVRDMMMQHIAEMEEGIRHGKQTIDFGDKGKRIHMRIEQAR